MFTPQYFTPRYFTPFYFPAPPSFDADQVVKITDAPNPRIKS